MENLQAYMFIAIVVVIAIFSVIKEAGKRASKEKRVVVPQQHKQNSSKDKGFSEWEEWNLEKEEETFQDIPIFSTIQEKIEVQSPKENHFIPKKEIKHEPKVLSDNSKLKINSREEVRRAIIYSEIINRKYK